VRGGHREAHAYSTLLGPTRFTDGNGQITDYTYGLYQCKTRIRIHYQAKTAPAEGVCAIVACKSVSGEEVEGVFDGRQVHLAVAMMRSLFCSTQAALAANESLSKPYLLAV